MQSTSTLEKKNTSLLEIIREKSQNGKQTVPVQELFNDTGTVTSQNVLLKRMFRLLLNDTIELSFNRRDKDEVYIKYSESKVKPVKDHISYDIKKIIDLFNLYLNVSSKPAIQYFHLLTKNNFRNNLLFNFLEKAGADITDYKILIQTIYGFLSGMHPAFLNDMNLSTSELANYTRQFLEKEGVLIQQDLLRIRIDPDGVTCKTGITKRTLQLLQNEQVPVLKEVTRRHFGFYHLKLFETIKEIKMHYNSNTEKLFQQTCRLVKNTDNLSDTTISLLLYGPPGTGKTEFAYQLARQTGADIMQLDFSQLHSKWIGETEKNVREVFSEYQHRMENFDRPVILLMNEADGLMNRRVTVSTSNDIFSNQVQSQLLEILEEFKGILIATTNLYKNIDEAFHRRFLVRCLIDFPEIEIRKGLLNESQLSKYLSETGKQKILNSKWTAAQLKNAKYKIHQLNMQEALDEQDILELFEQDGLLRQSKQIGFK